MIWFGNTNRLLAVPEAGFGFFSETKRMQAALERVAERAPGLSGQRLVDALAGTGWVDRATAQRLLPVFRNFDPDRHFAEYLRGLSFRGRPAAEEFLTGIRAVVEEVAGSASIGRIGPEGCVRFQLGDREGLVLAQPEVALSISGPLRDSLVAAVAEMPDVVVVVARTFDPHANQQLASVLDRTGVPGTLVTVNLMLGIRAMTLRYQPHHLRVVDLLSTGGMLRSAHIARLGEREVDALSA